MASNLVVPWDSDILSFNLFHIMRQCWLMSTERLTRGTFMGKPAANRSDMTSEGDADVPGAQALLRGLDLLQAIGTAVSPPRFKDLEKSLGIPRASLHRLLAALA